MAFLLYCKPNEIYTYGISVNMANKCKTERNRTQLDNKHQTLTPICYCSVTGTETPWSRTFTTATSVHLNTYSIAVRKKGGK